MNFTAQISGMDAVFQMQEAALNRFAYQINGSIQAAGLQAAAVGKQKCPVGTPESTGKKGYMGGRLRASIQYSGRWMYSEVRTNVFYGPYVNFGTRHMKARPFFTQGFNAGAAQLNKDMRQLS